MKKRVLLLLPLFLGACSDSGESPVIKIEKLYAKIESDGENTAQFENLGELVKNTIFVA